MPSVLQGSELKSSRQYIIHKVVQVVTLNQPPSLVSRVHCLPAQTVIRSVPLHEMPHGVPHHWHRVHGGQQKELLGLVNHHTITKELTCIR